MKLIALVLGLFGCDQGEELPDWCPDQHQDEVDETLVAEPPRGENSVAIWAPGEPWGSRAGQEAALAGCRMWEPVGFTCHLVADPEDADIVVDYVDAGCDYIARNDLFGACNQKGTIWINTSRDCQPPNIDHVPWLSQVVAHEIGHSLLFIQEVPQFCGEAVMNPAIERFREYSPVSAITEGDRHACTSGMSNITLRTGVEVPIDCGVADDWEAWNDLPIDDCAEAIEAEPTVVSIWLEEDALEWQSSILAGCAWWSPVGVSCVLAPSRDEADAVVRDSGETCTSVGGISFKDKTLDGRWAVELADPCWDPDHPGHVESDLEAEQKIERIFAHELGHVIGVDHVPYFCADALMNPSPKRGRTCITPADVSAWQERFVR